MPSPHDLTIRQLQYVVAVADTLGFHKAADRCHVSQPTLSAQVRQVESVLGVTIFERDKRVLVTPAGAEIVARARRVLLDVDDLLATAASQREPFAGTVRIGVIPTIAPYLLPEIVPRVRTKYPKLTLVFLEEKTRDVARGLADGTIDAGLVALESDLGEGPRAEVMRDPFVAALPKGHPLAKKKSLSLSDLEDAHVLLLDEGHCLRDQALALCSRAGATETSFRATSLSTLAQMVSSGAGITLLPAMAVGVENRRGQLEIRPFTGRAPGRTITLVWREHSPVAPVCRELAKLFRAGAGDADSLTAT